MNIWLVLGILLALGIIVGNVLLLKYSANMKFEKTSASGKDKEPQTKKPSSDQNQS